MREGGRTAGADDPWLLRALLRALVLGAAYAASSQAVQVVTAFGDETSSSTFWPAAGLTVAALLMSPRREWPFLLVAVWIAETALDLHNGFGLVVSSLWGLANVAEPLLAASLLRIFGRGRPNLATRDGLLRFVGFAVIVGPAVGATIGAVSSVAFADDVLWPRLTRWFIGDAIGVLTLAPLFLAWGITRQRPGPREAALPIVALVGTMLVASAPWSEGARHGLPYLVLPALVLVALRFGARESAVAIAIVALTVEVTTAASAGPFAEAGSDTALVEAQMFLAMSAFSCWAITALGHDLSERERAAAALLAETFRDQLTGVANRRRLLDRLDQLSARIERNGGTATLLYLDLDGFKAINDRHGHAAGDEVLKVLADRLRGAVRAVDTVARLGGDEFAVLTDQCETDHDAHVLRVRLEQLISRPVPWKNHELCVSASIGTTKTSRLDDVEAFLDEADRAMYRAKLARRPPHGARLPRVPERR